MPAPLAKGLIIATSIIIAAGIAFYENEQIREWIEMSRRRIAIALQGPGSDASPEERERLDAETQHLQREENIRLTRIGLLRKAREEGVAVDLDELAAIGKDGSDLPAPTRSRTNTATSFDELVGTDGMLRDRDITSGQATGVVGEQTEGLRNRGARGFLSGLTYANPFEDEANILHDEDKDLEEALRQSRETSHTLTSETQHASPIKSEAELEAEIEEAIRRSLEEVSAADKDTSCAVTDASPPLLIIDDTPEMSQLPSDPPTSVPGPLSMPGSVYESFYYGPHPNLENQKGGSGQSSFHSATDRSQPPPPQIFLHDNEYDMPSPSGTLTPTEEGFSTVASIAGTASDIGVLAELESALSEHEASQRDEEVMSESEASEAFSEVGVSTPGDWTDVESNPDEDEMREIPPQAIGH